MIMAPELPSRPKPDPDEEHTIIEPTDRVKSAHDKPDPRFEAARQKAEREAKVYSERAEKAGTEPDDEQSDEQATEADAPESKGTFSFNMTAGDAEEDE